MKRWMLQYSRMIHLFVSNSCIFTPWDSHWIDSLSPLSKRKKQERERERERKAQRRNYYISEKEKEKKRGKVHSPSGNVTHTLTAQVYRARSWSVVHFTMIQTSEETEDSIRQRHLFAWSIRRLLQWVTSPSIDHHCITHFHTCNPPFQSYTLISSLWPHVHESIEVWVYECYLFT